MSLQWVYACDLCSKQILELIDADLEMALCESCKYDCGLYATVIDRADFLGESEPVDQPDEKPGPHRDHGANFDW